MQVKYVQVTHQMHIKKLLKKTKFFPVSLSRSSLEVLVTP